MLLTRSLSHILIALKGIDVRFEYICSTAGFNIRYCCVNVSDPAYYGLRYKKCISFKSNW